MRPLRKPIMSGGDVHAIKARLRKRSLHTVCEEARCPNLSECFSRGTATFMILGNICTRSCGFCNVRHIERPLGDISLPVDREEPANIAAMVRELGLRHAVITSVTRDDLPDEGSGHFASVIDAIRKNPENITIEVLTPDFHARPDCIGRVCGAGPDIFNHNIETVRRITPIVRSNADYERSLNVLRWVKGHYPHITVKSGIMVGLGETREEVLETLKDLCNVSCEIVTIGQYLAPSRKNLPVVEYLSQDVFEEFKVKGEELGIKHVFSGPFIRSSYMAETLVGHEGHDGATKARMFAGRAKCLQ